MIFFKPTPFTEPLRNGAYINHNNTRAVLFTNATNIMLVEGSAGLNDLCDAYTQARVRVSAPRFRGRAHD